MVVTGTPAIIDDDASGTSAQPRTADGGVEPGADASLDDEADWDLAKGWNLVSNPLVNMVSKYTFLVCDGDNCKSMMKLLIAVELHQLYGVGLRIPTSIMYA